MDLIGFDEIAEMVIMTLLEQFDVEIAIAALILSIMSLGIILMTLVSLVACLVIPPFYVHMAYNAIKDHIKKLKGDQ